MKFIAIVTLLFSLSVADVICETGKVYAKITKKTLGIAEQESFVILDGTTALYYSPTLVNNEERVIETCLPVTASNQYTLRMIDSNTWTNGAWIMIEGINGNRVFKQMMALAKQEEYMFSLYSPINKGDTWKYSATADASWTQTSFSDATWTDIVTGSTTQQAAGTQYFRHSFVGSAGQAAIDMQVFYRYGVIAYINGVEIYRDNMPEGPATSSTAATASYATAGYHGVIRPSDIAENAVSVLAVEMHPTAENMSTAEDISFNAFLSFLAGISTENKCFVMPYEPTLTNVGFTNQDNAFSWTYTTRASSSVDPASITADYSNCNSLPMINGIRLWPHNSPSSAITDFTVEVSDATSGPYTTIYESGGNVYISSQWKQYIRATPADRHKYIRFNALAAPSTTKGIYELQYMICNIPSPTTISYTIQKNSFYRNFDEIKFDTDVYGYTNCQVNPALPAGVLLNTQTCSISGMPTEAKPQTTYTISGMVGTLPATGTITFTVTDCTTSFYKIVRTYKSTPHNESFRIYDTVTSTIIYEVQQGHSGAVNVDWEYYICIAQERFDVVFYHTDNYWAANSYFYLYYLLPNNEQEMVLKGRFDAYQETDSNVYVRRPSVGHSEQWRYKFDSVPANWYTADVFNTWSQNTRDNFGTATNKIQLFAKTFNVNNLNEVKGYILSIRYKYGCVVYLNGHEAFRNGVAGDITSNPSATNSYNNMKYHIVTLPGRTIPTATEPTVTTYLQQGVNTIAIALVAIADSQTTVDFDCVVRLMPSELSESHIWELSGNVIGMNGEAMNAFSMYYNNILYNNSADPCTTNKVEITLDNDRREWVSSMHVQIFYTRSALYDDPAQFEVYARNPEDADWTLLREVRNITFSLPGQKRRIYFQNNKPYNQFKFENIFPSNHTIQCKWRLSELNLFADNVLVDLAPLTYPASIEIYKDIEMAEIIPDNGFGHFNFIINPALPAGVSLDGNTGWITGTALAPSPATTYTITASKLTGGTATSTISLGVAICTGGRSLVTVRFRADSYPAENSWKLFQGRGDMGAVLQQVDKFPVSGAYYYIDFCLPDGIYTFEGMESYGDGWAVNSGYTLTADVGAMEFEIMEMQNSDVKPIKVSTVFSTYFPFQMEYTEWKVNQNGYAAGWNTIAFDDSTWEAMKAAEIPTTEQVTTYIRKTFTLTNIADYQVLNIRMKYSGGVAAYFNGNLVARINLEENFNANTESIEVHDETIDAKFHIILPTSGMVEGTNVMAFEVHRPVGMASSVAVVFDATGVFGVDDCPVVLDSYSQVNSTDTTAGFIEAIMDLDPFTTGSLPNAIGTYIEWSVDNLLGSKWNTFNIYGGTNRVSWGFDVRGYWNPESTETVTLFSGVDLTMNGRERTNINIPASIAGFRKYRWEVTDPSSSTGVLNAFFFNYCKASGAVCPGIENYPSVGEGQISPSTCPDGYTGYSYRECAGGQLGEIKMDKCLLLPPHDAHYRRAHYEFVLGTQVTTGLPEVKNIPFKWYLDEGITLPAGLTMNQKTGEISGTPTAIMEVTEYTVYVENDVGATSVAIAISVRKGQCVAEGVFPSVEVNEVATYDCAVQGAYVGTMQRACTLGTEDGVWETASGFCVSIFIIVILIVVAIIIVVVVVLLLIRASKKAKIVGGVKGKKNTKSPKTPKSGTTKMAITAKKPTKI